MQVFVEFGDHLARLQALAVRREALDPPGHHGHQCEILFDDFAHAGTQHLDRDLADSSVDRADGCEMHLRDRCARYGRFIELNEDVAEWSSEGSLDGRDGHLRREGRHPILQPRELVGDVRRQQIPPGRQHLAELDEDRPKPFQRLAQSLAARRIEISADRHNPGHHAKPGLLEAREDEFVEAVAERDPDDEDAAIETPHSAPAGPPALPERVADKAPQPLHHATGARRDRVRRHIADSARKIVLHVPAHVVHQPVDLGGQLHVALDANGRLLAAKSCPGKTKRRFLRHAQREFGHSLFGRQVEQAGWRGNELHRHEAPFEQRHPPLLPHQALLGLGLLLQHVI